MGRLVHVIRMQSCRLAWLSEGEFRREASDITLGAAKNSGLRPPPRKISIDAEHKNHPWCGRRRARYDGVMCGRFTLSRRDGRSLAAELGVAEDSFADYHPRYNIAPMQNHFVVTLERENRKVPPARWELANSWARDNKRAARCINAKAETVEKLPTFRAAFKPRRCVVPADGFYEWRGPKGKCEPLWIHPRVGGLILFAGLYEVWRPESSIWKTTFTIITTAANRLIEPIHNRMPVILSDRIADDRMNPNEADPLSLKRLLVAPPDDLLVVTPASPLVNSVKNEGPELLRDCDPGA